VLAAAMRAIAARHHIPVVRSPALARQLYRQVEPGVAVPTDLYAPVARILVWVLAMRAAREARAPQAPQAPHASHAAHVPYALHAAHAAPVADARSAA